MRAADAPVSAATVPLLMQAITDPASTVGMVAEVVASDAGLAARVLALANSAAFGLSRQVTDVQQAVSMVGSNMCQTLAIAGSCNLLDGAGGLPHAREHAIRTACAARMLAGRAGLNKADAFAAGLLHDLGEILLWRQDPETYAAAHAGWRDEQEQLHAERGMFGTDHALAAREQLAAWRIPGVVVDAVGDHHRPDLQYVDLSTLVIAAEELAGTGAESSARLELFGVPTVDLAAVRDDLDAQAADMGALLTLS